MGMTETEAYSCRRLFPPLSITRVESSQHGSGWRLNVPILPSFVVVKDTGPSRRKGRRKLPAHLLIVQPQADQVPFGAAIVLKFFAAVQNGLVINEAHIPCLHSCRELVLACNKIDSIKGFRLRLCETRYAFRARTVRMTGQKAAREVEKYLSIKEVQERALVVGRIAAES